MNCSIDLAIIGAQKCGTTSLYHWLRQHPRFFAPSVKELPYFVRPEFYSQGPGYLTPFYSDARSDQVLCTAHVHTLYFASAAERLRKHNPEMTLVAILRNPIDRAYSAYWFARNTGREPIPRFEDALVAETVRAEGSFQDRSELTYVRHGYYAEQLEPYLSCFGSDRLQVYLTDDLRSNPEQVLGSIFRSLDIEDSVPIDSSRRRNESSWPRSMWLSRLIFNEYALKRIFRRYTGTRLRYNFRQFVIRPLARWNIRPFRYPPMNPETRIRLRQHFEPHSERLGALLGRDLSGWS